MFTTRTPSTFPDRGVTNLRKGRRSESGRVYHVTFATAACEPLFADWDSACAAARSLAAAGAWRDARLLCWVLMPDHWHGLVELGASYALSSVIRRAKGRSARTINHALSRQGKAVWAPGFRDHAVRAEEDMADIARYIVLNPVRAGLVSRRNEYPFWNAIWLGADDRGSSHSASEPPISS
jgi:REP element-mobilizing transposase RayT